MRTPGHARRFGAFVVALLLACVLLPASGRAGLDLLPLGKAKLGHEAEWEQLMAIVYQGGRHSTEQVARLEAISVPPSGDGDGLAKYTHAGLYGSLDGTSFRGTFLKRCEGLLGRELLEKAWTFVMSPTEAMAYGRQLLAIAEESARGERTPAHAEKKRVWVGADKPVQETLVSLDEQIDILRAAGRWYVYWGERGHPIHAWW